MLVQQDYSLRKEKENNVFGKIIDFDLLLVVKCMIVLILLRMKLLLLLDLKES